VREAAIVATPDGECLGADGFVLVHGGYHGAWCWERLLPLLRGPVLAVDLPGRGRHPLPFDQVTIEGSADSVVGDIDSAGLGRVVLVGHSLGGATLPVVAGRLGERVVHMVFVSCLVVADGESVSAPGPERERLQVRLAVGPDARTELTRDQHRMLLCNDMDAEQEAATLGRVGPDSFHFFTDTVSWRGVAPTLAKTYVRLARDQALPPGEQARMIARLGPGVSVRDLDAGHEVMITKPDALAAILNPLLGPAPDLSAPPGPPGR
jgi:pimeloyl-ACP methyl ester carboxylesterase